MFQGPQAYVSPAWYPSKAEHGKVVPTWNYVMVQARGRLRAIEDPAWLHAFVTRLTDRHEQARAAPWAVSDAPADYVATMLKAIVGLELVLDVAHRQVEGEPEPLRRRSRGRGATACSEASGGDAARALAAPGRASRRPA